MRTTSALVGMAELLADLAEGEGIGPNAVCELCQATDLSLRAMAAPGGH